MSVSTAGRIVKAGKADPRRHAGPCRNRRLFDPLHVRALLLLPRSILYLDTLSPCSGFPGVTAPMSGKELLYPT